MKNITEIKHFAFKDTHDIFMDVSNLFLTLADDLFGSRASDNQVKCVSNRKADREGHFADAVADALSCVVLALQFKRRGESDVN